MSNVIPFKPRIKETVKKKYIGFITEIKYVEFEDDGSDELLSTQALYMYMNNPKCAKMITACCNKVEENSID